MLMPLIHLEKHDIMRERQARQRLAVPNQADRERIKQWLANH